MFYYQHIEKIKDYDFRPRVYENFECTAHIHIYYEIIYVIDGVIDVFINMEKKELKKDEMLLILPHQIHAYHTIDNSKIFICVFSDDVLSEINYTRYKNHICRKLKADSFTKEIISKLENGIYCSDYKFLSFAYNVFDMFCESAYEMSFESIKENMIIFKIFEYINEHFKENINNKILARSLGYDKHYISTVFHNFIKTNIREVINTYRINYAKMLIKTTDKNISEIAFESGFQTIRCFNSVFLRMVKSTPKEYKKNINTG